MSKQKVNELGSKIRQLHTEIVELASCDMGHDVLTTQFNSELLSLINLALDGEEMVEKLFKLLEKQ